MGVGTPLDTIKATCDLHVLVNVHRLLHGLLSRDVAPP